jgi:hypothetical protein
MQARESTLPALPIQKVGHAMRKIFRGVGFILVLLFLAYAYETWENNKSVKEPGQVQIQATLEKSIVWLEQNHDKALADANPPLWNMVRQAAEITNDQRLRGLFAAYELRYLEERRNLWSPLFYPGTWVPVRFEDIAELPYYNWHFFYAILCDRELGDVPEIAAQNDPAFCDKYPLRPACATHQLVGIRLLQRSECGDAEQLDDTVDQLQQRIRKLLIMDPRVVDVYMQRVLMLVESGASEMVKPVWIKNLVDAQQADGGWSPFDPLVPLMEGYYFGYGQKFFSIQQPRSTFHTTAQGVLLFSLLSSR